MLNGAELEIDGYNFHYKEPAFPLISCSYSFNRTVDHNVRAASHVVFGLIKCEMYATKKLFLLDAMLTSFNYIDGTITFRDSLESGESYTAISLKFKGGSVIDFADSYNTVGYDTKMIRRFSLAVKEITVVGAEELFFTNDGTDS
ncbi:hypothetical protein G3O08_00675 [Cryomorpha ignava]|uniref:Type VI secretion system needle protein Hcp n=1 Tax=Cryomorpha ignava TaxID=101383 RepID=A0A7K3WK44_9FLAO|nr:type VI secretion system tube protein TssD [Cryomorpha ignava]NEN22017.1 hypothetical protein [Cryomorpha ignava]